MKIILRDIWASKYVLLFILFLFFLYSVFFISPGDYQYFSLIDDGQSLYNSSLFSKCFNELNCGQLKEVLIESTFGRVRPVYWFFQYIQFELLGSDASLHHQFRVFVLGSVILMTLFLNGVQAGFNKGSLLFSSVIFFTTYTFAENIIRLGPTEPYQLIFIGLFSYVYLYRYKFKSDNERYKTSFNFLIIFLLVSSLLIKETSIALPLTVLFTSLLLKKSKNERYYSIIILTVGFFLTLIGRLVVGEGGEELSYSDNFQLSPTRIFTNISLYYQIITQNMPVFTKLLPVLLTVLLVLKRIKVNLNKEILFYWLILLILSIGILLPWKFALDRYVMSIVYIISFLMGYLINILYIKLEEMVEKLNINKIIGKLTLKIIFIYVLISLFLYGYSLNFARVLNYNSWYKTYLKFEYDQVEALSELDSDKIYINAQEILDNWEVLYEIPIHLEYIYNVDKEIKTFSADSIEFPIFSSTSLKPVVELDEKSDIDDVILINSNEYTVEQIDPLEFREKFRYKPVSTLLNPPYKDDTFNYHWTIHDQEN